MREKKAIHYKHLTLFNKKIKFSQCKYKTLEFKKIILFFKITKIIIFI